MNRFIITEEEKKNILNLYKFLNEQDYGIQYLNIGEISGKTYELYLEKDKKSTKFEWVKTFQNAPLPKSFLPENSNFFKIQIEKLTYYSTYSKEQYSFKCKPQTNVDEIYYYQSMYTDVNLLKDAKFRVAINYPRDMKGKNKHAHGTLEFYGYCVDLKTDLDKLNIIK